MSLRIPFNCSYLFCLIILFVFVFCQINYSNFKQLFYNFWYVNPCFSLLFEFNVRVDPAWIRLRISNHMCEFTARNDYWQLYMRTYTAAQASTHAPASSDTTYMRLCQRMSALCYAAHTTNWPKEARKPPHMARVGGHELRVYLVDGSTDHDSRVSAVRALRWYEKNAKGIWSASTIYTNSNNAC